MNRIAEIQNEESMLATQYCARHCYNFAEILNWISWGLCLISVVVLNIPEISAWLGTNKAIIGAMITLITILIDSKKKYFVKLGAAFKTLFDYKLFGFETSDKFNGIYLEELKSKIGIITTRYPKSFMKQKSHNGTDKPNGVKDWYFNVSPQLTEDEAIRKCQQTNLTFDIPLTQLTQNIYMVLIAIIVAVLFALNAEHSLLDAVINLSTMISLIIKVVREIYGIIKLKITLTLIQSLIHRKTLSTSDIQKQIDERRNADVIIPNFIYAIKRNFLHISTINSGSIDI